MSRERVPPNGNSRRDIEEYRLRRTFFTFGRPSNPFNDAFYPKRSDDQDQISDEHCEMEEDVHLRKFAGDGELTPSFLPTACRQLPKCSAATISRNGEAGRWPSSLQSQTCHPPFLSPHLHLLVSIQLKRVVLGMFQKKKKRRHHFLLLIFQVTGLVLLHP